MARDDEDFTMIFEAHYAGLCRFLECMMSGTGCLAQDIAQETFMRLYRHGPESLPAGEARFWLFRVARNLAINELSRQQTRKKILGRVRNLFGQRAPDPEEDLEHKEQRRILFTLLNSLPEHERAALVLREQREMSYREIAHVLNI